MMGLAAFLVIIIGALFAKGGLVNLLVVLYSINLISAIEGVVKSG
jgi:hypothetical protein